MTYEVESQKPASKKYTLAWVEPSERLIVFTADGSNFKRDLSKYVIGVEENGNSLQQNSNASLALGQWYFNDIAGQLQIRTSDDSDPKTKRIYVTYRLFYSNVPINLPYDLESGTVVHYEGRIKSVSNFSQKIDEKNNISLEGSGNLSLIKNDGAFIEEYDKLFFENKSVKIFSYLENLPASESKILFDGLAITKAYTTKTFNIGMKDFFFKLREPLKMNLFSSSDGTLPDSLIGKPKRRLYGRCNVRTVSVDQTLDGFTGAGSVDAAQGSTIITGTGTDFINELSPDDEIVIDFPDINETLEIKIDSVDSSTQITLSEEIGFGFIGEPYTVRPSVPYRRKNREWFIADHKLRAPETTVTEAISLIRLRVASTSDMSDGDTIFINSDARQIRRIINDEIVLKTNLGTLPLIGDPVIKSPIFSAHIGNRQIQINRDYTVTNAISGSKLVLSENAEFNITRPRTVGNCSFTIGSTQVTSATLNFEALGIKPRDFIRSADLSTEWLEVLSVDSNTNTLILRENYTGATSTLKCQLKSITYLEDDSQVTADCFGLEFNGEYIKNGSQAVRHILEQDLGLTNIDSDSFDQAEIDAPYELSLAIPVSIDSGTAPQAKEIIEIINNSVFGQLVNNLQSNLKYLVIAPDKNEDVQVVFDDDRTSFSVTSRDEIFRKVTGNYRHLDSDMNTGEQSNSQHEFVNDFVDESSKATRETSYNFHVYNQNDAETLTERYSLFHSLTNGKVTVRGKLNLATRVLGDVLQLNFRKMYQRYASTSVNRIARITSISKNGKETTVTLNDYGNMYSRVNSIAPETTNDFSGALEDELTKFAFICDNDTEIPDSNPSDETSLGSNIIG